jgi:hypothetical protein
LLAALSLALLWWLGLVLLALLTANPVTINREQVLKADAIVEAAVTNLAKGEIRIQRVQNDRGTLDVPTLRLPNLAETKAEPGATYLIPLSRTGIGYEVTRTSLPGQLPLVYPATPETAEQLQRHLSANAAQ